MNAGKAKGHKSVSLVAGTLGHLSNVGEVITKPGIDQLQRNPSFCCALSPHPLAKAWVNRYVGCQHLKVNKLLLCQRNLGMKSVDFAEMPQRFAPWVFEPGD